MLWQNEEWHVLKVDLNQAVSEQSPLGFHNLVLFVKIFTVDKVKYLHFHCESLKEPLHLRRGSYLHEQIRLSHTHIRAIWAG